MSFLALYNIQGDEHIPEELGMISIELTWDNSFPVLFSPFRAEER
jgi:hypothetical protein